MNDERNKELRELFQSAIDKWGQDFQLKMVAEECAELIKAVLKLDRKVNGYTIEQVIDEIADVYIMLGQLEVIIDGFDKFNTNAMIDDKFNEKIERLKQMIKGWL